MKKMALLLPLLFVVAGVASATETKAAKPAVAKTHVVEAEVVSSDVTAKTLTIKGEKENAILKVDASAVSQLKALKAGEKVKLTCRDNDKGEHEAITHIVAEKAAPAKK
jgi:hypothetical protein